MRSYLIGNFKTRSLSEGRVSNKDSRLLVGMTQRWKRYIFQGRIKGIPGLGQVGFSFSFLLLFDPVWCVPLEGLCYFRGQVSVPHGRSKTA
jgi:hypothetical protein